MSFVEAQTIGLAIDGPKAFTRVFPKWFDLYLFAHIGAAGRKTEKSRAALSDHYARVVTLRTTHFPSLSPRTCLCSPSGIARRGRQMVSRKARGHSLSHVAPMPVPASNCIDPSQGR